MSCRNKSSSVIAVYLLFLCRYRKSIILRGFGVKSNASENCEGALTPLRVTPEFSISCQEVDFGAAHSSNSHGRDGRPSFVT